MRRLASMNKLLNFLYDISDNNIFIFLGLCFLVLFIVIGIIVGLKRSISYGIRTAIENVKINVRSLSTNKEWVNACFYGLAHEAVEERFEKQEKLVYTQSGDYRANYLDEVDREVLHYRNVCCDGDRFNEDFCKYSDSFTELRRKDLVKLIHEFLVNKEKTIEERRFSFLSGMQTISPEEFFEMRTNKSGDIVGVYIIHNESTEQYYVGQSKRVFFRVNQHFTGHGNGDVYADYVHGNSFKIQILKLSESGYDDLDRLERDMIKKYKAHSIGYNRTSGNY